MTGADRRAARAALAAARPTLARLHGARDAEENAADLIELWSSIETALRSLLGGSPLAGQPLIRELRQRELLNIDQAHALLEFLAVRERVQRTDYRPSDDDVAVAREAVDKLEQTLPADRPARSARDEAPAPARAPAPVEDAIVADQAPVARQRGPVLVVGGVLVLLLVAAVGAFMLSQGTRAPAELQRGRDFYTQGRRQEARREFEIAARKNPNLALPHVFLGRIARDEGDTTRAFEELSTAVKLDTNSALAYRELAAFLLSRGRLEPARRFYIRALQKDQTDRTAQGFLGCTLMRLGRVDEGMRWLNRAGPGDWSSCASLAQPSAPPPTPRP